MADVDELETRVRHGRQNGDVGMTAEAKDVLYATIFKVTAELICDQVFACFDVLRDHYITSVL